MSHSFPPPPDSDPTPSYLLYRTTLHTYHRECSFLGTGDGTQPHALVERTGQGTLQRKAARAKAWSYEWWQGQARGMERQWGHMVWRGARWGRSEGLLGRTSKPDSIWASHHPIHAPVKEALVKHIKAPYRCCPKALVQCHTFSQGLWLHSTKSW